MTKRLRGSIVFKKNVKPFSLSSEAVKALITDDIV